MVETHDPMGEDVEDDVDDDVPEMRNYFISFEAPEE